MAGETVVVQTAPNSEPQLQAETQAIQTQAAIVQAENYGAMSEAFRQTQIEAARMLSEIQLMKAEQERHQTLYREIQAQNEKLMQAIQEESEEEETPLPDNSNTQATVITPPIITPVAVTETKPTKKQSRMNLFLFGREDEE